MTIRPLTRLLPPGGIQFIAVLFLLYANVVQSAQVVLQDVRIEASGENKTRIHIDFGLPLTYVKHFPQLSGEILQVQLQLPPEIDREIHKEVLQGLKDLRPPEGRGPLLIYVTYEEGVPGGPYLTLRFNHSVKFDVSTGTNLLSLVINIQDDKPLPPPVEEEPVPDAMIAKEPGVETPETTLPPGVGKAPADERPARDISEAQEPTTEQLQAEVPDATTTQGELMAKARQALTFGDNVGAIELLRRVIADAESTHTQEARELMGLALERSGEVDRAKFQYNKYLRVYKEGDGVERVRQRLSALEDLALEKRKKLRRASRSKDGESYSVFGRWSQAYTSRFQEREPEDEFEEVSSEDIVLARRVDSHLTMRGRYRSERETVQAVVSFNNSMDMIRADESESQFSTLKLDYDAFEDGYNVVVGRQRARRTGIFTRYDGIFAGYQALPWLRANIYGGKPVNLFTSEDAEQSVWGFSADISQQNDPFSMNIYYVSNTYDGHTNREAVGGIARLNEKDQTFFTMIDFDVYFSQVTLFNARWGWKYDEDAKLNISYNFTENLVTSTALRRLANNSNIETIDDILVSNTEKEMIEFAKDSTSANDNLTIGNSYQFNKDNQLNVDLSLLRSSGIRDIDSAFDANGQPIGSISGYDGTGLQYTLSGQWISSNLFSDRDLYVFGVSYSDFDNYSEVRGFATGRLPQFDRWKPRPRLAVGHREIKSGNQGTGTRFSLAPSLKIDYRWKKEWVFDVEVGFEILEYSDPNFFDQLNQDIRVGYHYTF